ncbi:hypothetical protein BH10BAC5_BH10BAC5_06290 [soil metagenome]
MTNYDKSKTFHFKYSKTISNPKANINHKNPVLQISFFSEQPLTGQILIVILAFFFTG